MSGVAVIKLFNNRCSEASDSSARLRSMPTARFLEIMASVCRVVSVRACRANIATTPIRRSSTNKRIAGKGDHAFAFGPFLMADAWIARHLVGQMRLPFLGNESDLELTDGHASMRAVKMRV